MSSEEGPPIKKIYDEISFEVNIGRLSEERNLLIWLLLINGPSKLRLAK